MVIDMSLNWEKFVGTGKNMKLINYFNEIINGSFLLER